MPMLCKIQMVLTELVRNIIKIKIITSHLKWFKPNINNTNQVPDSNLNMILGFTLFLIVIIAAIVIGLWRKNGNLNKRFWFKRNSKNILELSIKDKYQQIIDKQKEFREPEELKEENHHKSDIREIKKLYNEGILTEEEFKKAKKKILDI